MAKRIVHLDVRPCPGGYVRFTAVVDCEITAAARIEEETQKKDCELIIKPIAKKRTLTANAYYQVLLDKLNAVLRTDRRELHQLLLARHGVSELDKNGDPIMFVMREDISPKELGDIYVDAVGYEDGMVTYRVLKGSSRMDTREFAALLDGLIEECKEQGIETLSDEEITRLFEVPQ